MTKKKKVMTVICILLAVVAVKLFTKVRRKAPAFRHGDIRHRKRDRFTNLRCRKIVNVV